MFLSYGAANSNYCAKFKLTPSNQLKWSENCVNNSNSICNVGLGASMKNGEWKIRGGIPMKLKNERINKFLSHWVTLVHVSFFYSAMLSKINWHEEKNNQIYLTHLPFYNGNSYVKIVIVLKMLFCFVDWKFFPLLCSLRLRFCWENLFEQAVLWLHTWRKHFWLMRMEKQNISATFLEFFFHFLKPIMASGASERTMKKFSIKCSHCHIRLQSIELCFNRRSCSQFINGQYNSYKMNNCDFFCLVSLSMKLNLTHERRKEQETKNETVKSTNASKRGQKKCVKHKWCTEIESKWKNVQLMLVLLFFFSSYSQRKYTCQVKTITTTAQRRRRRWRKNKKQKIKLITQARLFPFVWFIGLLKCRLQLESGHVLIM